MAAGATLASEDADTQKLLRELATAEKELKRLQASKAAAASVTPAASAASASSASSPAAGTATVSPARTFPGWSVWVPSLMILYYLRDSMGPLDLFMAGAFLTFSLWFGQRMVNKFERSAWRQRLRDSAEKGLGESSKAATDDGKRQGSRKKKK